MQDTDKGPRVTAGGLVVIIRREQLLAACAARGLSLAQLAKAAGVSLPTIRALATGKQVRPITAFKVALALSRLPAAPDCWDLLEAS